MQFIGQRGGVYDTDSSRPFRQGTFGRVYRAALSVETQFLPAGSQVALKLGVKGNGRDVSREKVIGSFKTERVVLEGTLHPNLVRLYDFGERQGLPFIVEELCPGRRLTYRLREAAHWRMVATGLLGALGALHGNGVAHGDVEGKNIIFDRKALKLVDLGSAIYFDRSVYPRGWRIDLDPAIEMLMRQLENTVGYSETVRSALFCALREGFGSSAGELKEAISRACGPSGD